MSNRYKTDYLIHQLEAAGKRSTPQRHAVCEALIEHGGHPTVADIYEHVRGVFPMISQATVYNTIDTLQELGLIRPLEVTSYEHTLYDLDLTPHVNLVCARCNRITDVYTTTVDALLTEVERSSGYTVDRQTPVVAYGVCADCRAMLASSTHHTN